MSSQDDKFLIEEIFNRILFPPKDEKAKDINENFWELISMGEFTVAAEVHFAQEYWPKICQECTVANLVLDRETAIEICKRLIGDNANDVYLPTIMNDQNMQQINMDNKADDRPKSIERIKVPDKKEMERIKNKLKEITKNRFAAVRAQSANQYERFAYTVFKACEAFITDAESEGLQTTAEEAIKIIIEYAPILRHFSHEFQTIMKNNDKRLRAIKPKKNEEIELEESRRIKLEKEIEADWADIDESEAVPQKTEFQKKISESIFSPLVLKELDLSTSPPRMIDFKLELTVTSLNDYFTKSIGDLPKESFSKKIKDLVSRMRVHATQDRKIDGLIHLKGLMHQLFKIYNSKFEAVLAKIVQKTKKDEQVIRPNLDELSKIIRRAWEELEEDFGHKG